MGSGFLRDVALRKQLEEKVKEATKTRQLAEETITAAKAVIDSANNAWKVIEKGLHEHLSSSFSTAQSLLISAKNMGKDTAAVEDLLSRARAAVESNDFVQAIAFTKECLETVRRDMVREVER